MNLLSGNLFAPLQGVSHITVKIYFKIEIVCIFLHGTAG
jgi:hypothetical protein